MNHHQTLGLTLVLGLILLAVVAYMVLPRHTSEPVVPASVATSTPVITPAATSTPTASSTPVSTSGSITLKIGESGSVASTKLVLTAVTQDSRCPVNAECIQAGTVLADIQVGSQKGVAELGKKVVVGSYVVTLTNVQPSKRVGKSFPTTDYVLTFTVEHS